ncbi:hypothetical protein BRYFOR_06182 [Marvinbryantia formatexigens DSM 14469]|uniref:DUF3990 domain-containing protein n=1 Tax=Marvinbryantia formatexigens DSM 14469 TaxID=478749 RepID=C6LC35_9FIRM|nr:DUF3990 domain-containing protein [Marvinbryantia formatexigens]EET61988.1 hypothetical protein BRYFOR_06182 [Marvinbryantia formatexigens DSM 14469]UWO25685.1 DUF3990 domain-containing protein [Marvinbryantia formatexigens DSM 14469]SDF31617.1 Protein of unknown function [Marvinbryantia formatexigens]
MKLFHGSNMEIDKVDLSKCMPYKDFGRGFYTTLLEEQAWRMAQRRARIDGGIPTVTVYEIPENLVERADLNCRIFGDKPTVEWAVFIKNNRDRKFTDFRNPECNLDCKYDIVVGPVANDTVGLLIRQFSRGTIDAEYLKKEFDFGRLTNQYTFHTENALQYLKKVGVMYDQSAAGND